MDLPQLADMTIGKPFSSPLPASRPRTQEDKRFEHDALQTAAHAECLAAVKRTGVKPIENSVVVHGQDEFIYSSESSSKL